MRKASLSLSGLVNELRLWSDVEQLAAVVESLDWPREHLHLKGEPIRFNGPLAGRIAVRHYASIAVTRVDNWDEVVAWIAQCVGAISREAWFVDLLVTFKIEAVFWIGIVGKTPTSTPSLAGELRERLEALKMKIFCENYTLENGGGNSPLKDYIVP